MEFLRIIVATLGFIAGTFLMMGMFFDHFDWKDICAALLFYLFAHTVWPSKKRGKRNSESSVVDTIELIVEFPIEAIIWFFRALARFFRSLSGNKSEGIDLDTDF